MVAEEILTVWDGTTLRMGNVTPRWHYFPLRRPVESASVSGQSTLAYDSLQSARSGRFGPIPAKLLGAAGDILSSSAAKHLLRPGIAS